MVNLTLLKEKAKKFAEDQKDTSYEKGETSSFWLDFMKIFDIKDKVLNFEYQVKDGNNQTKFIDVIWKGNFIVEQKTKGKNLDKAFKQALGYTHLLSNEDRVDYIIVCDFNTFRLTSIKTNEDIEFTLEELPDYIENFDFIYNYGEKFHPTQEQLTLKASEVLAKIHDELESTNYTEKDLEIFLIRLLFCLYAEDTGIFDEYQFYDYIKLSDKNIKIYCFVDRKEI